MSEFLKPIISENVSSAKDVLIKLQTPVGIVATGISEIILDRVPVFQEMKRVSFYAGLARWLVTYPSEFRHHAIVGLLYSDDVRVVDKTLKREPTDFEQNSHPFDELIRESLFASPERLKAVSNRFLKGVNIFEQDDSCYVYNPANDWRFVERPLHL